MAVGYYPGGAGVTVVDLDSPAALDWARTTLPATRTVPTTRGQHWIYRGTCDSANAVQPGVDIKSHSQYARWLGPGTGPLADLPAAIPALLHQGRKEATPPPGAGVASSPRPAGSWAAEAAAGCRHTPGYLHTGLERGMRKIRACAESGAGSQTFGVARFLAAQHTRCPGPCPLDEIGAQLVAAAGSVGVPTEYAERAVANGFARALSAAMPA